MLFGVQQGKDIRDLYIQDRDFVPLKTGLPDYKLMKHGPKHIIDVDALEPLYIHHPSILEDCLRREANRVAHSENLMNRVVFDSIDSIIPQKPEEK